MSSSEYYNHTTFPATGAAGSSSAMRSELYSIESGISAKLPDLAGNGGKIVVINVAATGMDELASGDLTEMLVGGGAGALPVWTAATGTGAPVRANSPTFVTPALGTPASGVATNLTGTAAGLSIGGNAATATNASTVTTNANLTGHVTSTGNAAVLGSFTIAQLNTAVSDADVGYVNVPQNSQSTAYTLVLADAGKHILHPTADTTARTFTIPANASVAYPIGTAITFINQASAGVMTISITTDTMRLANTGATGSRTLAANGVATALKITATEWIISGGSALT